MPSKPPAPELSPPFSSLSFVRDDHPAAGRNFTPGLSFSRVMNPSQEEGTMRQPHAYGKPGPLCAALALALALPVAAAAAPATLRAGTVIDGVLQNDLGSATSKPGQKFTLVEKDRLSQRFAAAFHHQAPVLHGAHIEGHVESASKAGLGRNATLKLVFDDIVMPDGTALPIQAQLQSVLRPQTHHLRNTAIILGGAVAGHYAGKRTGMKHGTLAGAAAATAYVLASKSDIVVPSGTVLKLRLTQPVTLTTAALPASNRAGGA
jgi:hypothetical protein